MSIFGNVLSVNVPRTDYTQADPSRADYLLNKPDAAIAKAQQTAEEAKAAAEKALLQSGGSMSGHIAMGGYRITGLGAPTEGTDAATKAYVDARVAVTWVTLPAGGWSGKGITVEANYVTASNLVVVTPAPESWLAWCEAMVRCTAQGAGSLTFRCEAVPESDLSVQLLVLR